jgi:hypothetical protein
MGKGKSSAKKSAVKKERVHRQRTIMLGPLRLDKGSQRSGGAAKCR